jgi:hypothetical protein
MTPTTRDPAPGTFLRIPLADGSFAYGRAVAEGDIAFYDHRTTEPSDDLDEIAARPLLYTVSVRLLDPSRWDDIGQRPLEGAVAQPAVYFMQDLADYRQCTIFDTEGMTRSATPEECIGLERAVVWEQHGIERRLLDHFMGRPNETEIDNRVRIGDEP